MARIVLISPYLKGGQNAAKLAQRTRYVATRPGVKLLADGWKCQEMCSRETPKI